MREYPLSGISTWLSSSLPVQPQMWEKSAFLWKPPFPPFHQFSSKITIPPRENLMNKKFLIIYKKVLDVLRNSSVECIRAVRTNGAVNNASESASSNLLRKVFGWSCKNNASLLLLSSCLNMFFTLIQKKCLIVNIFWGKRLHMIFQHIRW